MKHFPHLWIIEQLAWQYITGDSFLYQNSLSSSLPLTFKKKLFILGRALSINIFVSFLIDNLTNKLTTFDFQYQFLDKSFSLFFLLLPSFLEKHQLYKLSMQKTKSLFVLFCFFFFFFNFFWLYDYCWIILLKLVSFIHV